MILDPEVLTPGNDRQLQFKDDDGLTLQQRALLQELAARPGDWRTACENADVKPSLLQSWLAKNASFQDAYNQLIGPALDIVQERIETLAHAGSDVYEEALEAVRYLSKDVSCPQCHHDFSVPMSGPDWNARLRSADTIMKVSKVLIDRKQIQQTTVNLSVEQHMALMSYKWSQDKGLPVTISPALINELRKLGEINDPTSTEVVKSGNVGLQPGDGDPSSSVQSG